MGESGGGGGRWGGAGGRRTYLKNFSLHYKPTAKVILEKTNDSNESDNNNWHIFMGHLFIILLELCGQALY